MIFCNRYEEPPIFIHSVTEDEFLENTNTWESITNENVFFCGEFIAPIQLQSFKVTILESLKVALEWNTISELNNDYFEIQRSRNGITWESITQIKGAGTTNNPKYYLDYDEHPFFGKTWYRLKQVDFDNKYSYSNTEEINMVFKNSLSIYPNPSRDHITISGKNIDLSQVKLYNGLGQELSQSIDIGSGIISHPLIDLSNSPANIYYLKIDETIHKIIKQ